MVLILRQPSDLPGGQDYHAWFATTDTAMPSATLLPPGKKWGDVATRLESAYDRCAETCWEVGSALAREPGAEIARTPTMGAYGTDFRLMVAWVELADELAASADRYLMLCDDPWLFREIAARAGVAAGTAPSLGPARTRLRLRGWLSRLRNAVRLSITALKLRPHRRNYERDRPAILVYGHPGSDAEGHDAYFGDLMHRVPDLQRVLHTDCGMPLAQDLASFRTASLHAWGNPLVAVCLVATRWLRVQRGELPYPWLLQRAQEVENSGAGPMMTRWQMHCQSRWLGRASPTVIVWPWENFAWERALCRSALRSGIPRIGYQHTVVGSHQINFAARLNPDGSDSLPDTIVCNGPGYRGELQDWGYPGSALKIGGAFRVGKPDPITFDANAPVFFALSGLVSIADEQVNAARIVVEAGRQVLFRDHPMYPMDIAETDNFRRARTGMLDQERLSAVVYSTGTSGLEAVMAGIPTIRFLPDQRVAVQVLPAGVEVPCATSRSLLSVLEKAGPPATVRWEQIFSPVDYRFWQSMLSEAADREAYYLA